MRKLCIAVLLALAVAWAVPSGADDRAQRRHPRPGQRYERRSHPPRQHYRPNPGLRHRGPGPYLYLSPWPRYLYRNGYRSPLCTYWAAPGWRLDPWGRPFWFPGGYATARCW